MIAEAIRALYPHAIPHVDFVVEDRGNGAILARWNTLKLGPNPTQQTLAAASEAIIRKRFELAVKAEAQRRVAIALGLPSDQPLERLLMAQVNGLHEGLRKTFKAFRSLAKKGALDADAQKNLEEAESLETVSEKIKAIRAFSNELEKQPVDTDIAKAAWPT